VPIIYAQYLYWYWYWYLKVRYWYWYWYWFVKYLIQDCVLPLTPSSPRSARFLNCW